MRGHSTRADAVIPRNARFNLGSPWGLREQCRRAVSALPCLGYLLNSAQCIMKFSSSREHADTRARMGQSPRDRCWDGRKNDQEHKQNQWTPLLTGVAAANPGRAKESGSARTQGIGEGKRRARARGTAEAWQKSPGTSRPDYTAPRAQKRALLSPTLTYSLTSRRASTRHPLPPSPPPS